MHELSICRSIAGIAAQHAGGRPISRIHVRVGQLRQIVPDTLTYCWGLVRSDDSELVVESVPASVDCRACGSNTVLTEPVPRCGACGGRDVVVVTGEEFLVTSLELGV
ncbi:MAG: hydrogenase maturation nickel metallochaperone HypA [Frankia sp.]|nr:hydrogenase maturation nickel metallochaperone HypA [Frankia sp.]